jgi:AMP nucleosidase
MKKIYTISPDSYSEQEVRTVCDKMDELFENGFYPHLEIFREYSKYNPRLTGEMAHPTVFRWYLKRELLRLLEKGATITLNQKRERIALNDPSLLSHMDEEEWDFTKKKLFLFSPERVDLSINRLLHYTGTEPKHFQRYILFTNYDMHVEVFKEKFPDAMLPHSESVQMPAYHWVQPNNTGISLVNIGVGPSNAKTITDHVSVLRPDAMIMVGHCGGLRNHQNIGDFVLANGYFRDDRVLDDAFPIGNPVIPNYLLNSYLKQALDQHGIQHRIGTVFTTANRNWEFSAKDTVQKIHQSRSVAIDMESATVATNGFRYRVPHATLLSVSDKPLHGKPKLSQQAQEFYNRSKKMHLELVLETIEFVKKNHPEGLPNSSIRSINEPLMGGV